MAAVRGLGVIKIDCPVDALLTLTVLVLNRSIHSKDPSQINRGAVNINNLRLNNKCHTYVPF